MGIYVAAATDKVRVNTSAAVASIKVQGSWVGANASTGVMSGMGIIKNNITTATDTDVLAGPGSTDFRAVKELTLRNTDASLSCDVTVSLYDGTNTFEKYKATLGPGDAIEYAEGVGFIFLSSALAKLDKLLFVTGSDVTNTTTSFADITGLTVALKSGKRYAILSWLHMIAAATTTGIQIGYNIGAAPTSAEFTALQIVTNSATAAALSSGEATARDTNIIAQTTGPAAIGPNLFGGMIVPSADGTFAMRIRSEVAASGVTAKVGSWLRVIEEK